MENIEIIDDALVEAPEQPAEPVGFYYAQLDENNIAVAETQAAGPIESAMVVRISAEDRVIGKKWTGSEWQDQEPVVVVRPQHISVGAFKRRLGMDAMSIANSTHPVCIALRELLYDQPYVDLSEGGELDKYLDMLIAVSQPDAHPMFPGSGPMTAEKKAAILGAPIQDRERP